MRTRFTNRLAELKVSDVNNSFREALDQIETNGVTVLHVLEDGDSLSWTYSTGLYDTYGQPEIIVSGFPSGLGGYVIHEAASRMEKGEVLKEDVRIAGMISNVDTIFLPIESRWKERLMLRACKFYGNSDFPAMQCICPDFQNVFPWEQNFDERWRNRQVQFFLGAKATKLEKQFWDATGPDDRKVH
jgi:Domain of unknown function (DUF4262)